jgi:hypothetical protein
MLAGGLLVMTMACAPVPPAEGQGEPPPRVEGAGECDAAGLGDLVGRPATTELGAEALRRSRARTLRWIRPGDMVTMDYRSDRLNIRLDAQHRVEAFSCG